MGTVINNRGTSCVGVRKTGTTLIRVSTVMGTLYALFKVCLGVTLVVLCIVVGVAYVTRMTKSSIVSDVLENNEGLERSLNNNQQLNQIIHIVNIWMLH